MTDNEIIKALELCHTQDGLIPCYDCPCWDDGMQKCKGLNHADLLGLINRQKAEIERLKECPKCVYEYRGEMTEYCVQGPCSNFKTVEEIKSEAYKEFTSRLKCGVPQETGIIRCSDVDNLVKETAGEKQ